MNIYKEMGLREVINADGKMTILGTSVASAAVADSMKSALQNFVVMEEMMDHAGRVIARVTGAEAGCPTVGAAAGIALSVAAAVTKGELARVMRIPDTAGLANEVVVQKGQVVNFGADVAQMVRIGGGVPVEVGSANLVDAALIEGAICEKTAALLYVKSHHAVQKGMQSIETMLKIAQRHGLPLIIDAAAEEDLKKYTAMGADAVLYSGGKAPCGPTSGFIAGKTPFIAACRAQYKGLGRAMKVSKEAMVGLVTALEQYDPANHDAEAQKADMQRVCDELNAVRGLSCRVVQDEAGRAIFRAEIRVDAAATGIHAAALDEKLRAGTPAIYLRGYYVNQGLLSIDPRPLFEGQQDIIVQKIKQYLTEA